MKHNDTIVFFYSTFCYKLVHTAALSHEISETLKGKSSFKTGLRILNSRKINIRFKTVHKKGLIVKSNLSQIQNSQV